MRKEIYFQPAKFKNVRISRKRVRPPRIYKLNGFDLEVVEYEKDLGVMIANDTSCKEHIVMIVAEANRMLGFLKRHCGGLVDIEALLVFTPHYYAPIYVIARKFGPLNLL